MQMPRKSSQGSKSQFGKQKNPISSHVPAVNVTYYSAMGKSLFAALTFVAVSYGASTPPLSVRLIANLPSPQPVGNLIGLAPRIENPAKGIIAVQYSVSIEGGDF